MHEIFLYFDGAAGRKTAEFNQLLAVRHAQERQMGPTGRHLAFQHLQTQHLRIEGDRLVHVADPHPRMKQFLNFHVSRTSRRVLSSRPRRFSQKDFSTAGNQKIGHRAYFLKALLAIEVARARVEV